jgi:hypothetical protein
VDALPAAAAYVGLGLAAVGIWLTWLYGHRTCALLKGLVRRDSHQ